MKAEISRKLHEIADYHLFGPGIWPADEEALAALWRVHREYGLAETVPGRQGTYRDSAIGIECHVEMMTIFAGAFELWEIPLILELRGYLDEEEADYLYSLADEKRAMKELHRHVQEAYFRFFRRSRFLN